MPHGASCHLKGVSQKRLILRNVPGNEDHFSDEASGAEELSDEVHQDRGAE